MSKSSMRHWGNVWTSERMTSTPSYRFFLGGADLEMEAIAVLLRQHVGDYAVVDHKLRWGAKASCYLAEIRGAIGAGLRPVLIELESDVQEEIAATCTVVDHHGDAAGADKPSSLRQVFQLLGLPPEAWTREMALIEGNDIGLRVGPRNGDVPTVAERFFATLTIGSSVRLD